VSLPAITLATNTGERYAAVAERRAEALAATTTARDAAGRFPDGLVAELAADGLAAMCVPVDLGGGGVTSYGDLMAVVARLGRGDGSTAIAANMHLAFTMAVARAGVASDLLAQVAAGEAWVSAAVTEAGTNYFHPATTLTPSAGGWRLEGSKVFATASPAATHLTVNAVVRGGELDGRLAMALVPATTPGVEVVDDWDGLGMRASGSGAVRLAADLPAETLVLPGGRYGEFEAGALAGRALGNVGNLAAMVGVAGGAAAEALAVVKRRERVGQPLADRPTVRQAVGEMVTELSTATAVAETLGRRADDLVAGGAVAAGPPDLAGAHAFMATFQAAKVGIHQTTIRTVDLAMDLAGGGAYVAGHPVGQRYRDLRAGPYMEPFSRHEALGYIGAVLTGREPDTRA
jgi:alkylation response protein AidB-like acyl-CoA dehydrogenase